MSLRSRLGAFVLLVLPAALAVAVLARPAPPALPAPVPLPEAVALEISPRARALAPGEIVLLSVRAARPVSSLTGTAFGRPVHFFATVDPVIWRGLLPIDVDATPGQHAVAIEGRAADGGRAAGRLVLDVLPKEFERRTLSVDPRFVNPPASELPRIQRESKRLAEVYAILTAERLWSGPFLRPVPGTTTSGFGRLSVFNGEPRGRHRGTDFRAAEGTPVRAPNAGRVVLSDDLYFSGGSVILDHGLALFSHFAHLSRRDVAEGDLVEPGQVVGLVGATGRVTGPHLHWTLRVGEAVVDPLSLIAALEADPVH